MRHILCVVWVAEDGKYAPYSYIFGEKEAQKPTGLDVHGSTLKDEYLDKK